MTPQEFQILIEKHDYFYNYSNDLTAFAKGQKERLFITGAINQNPEFREAWNQLTEKRNVSSTTTTK